MRQGRRWLRGLAIAAVVIAWHGVAESVPSAARLGAAESAPQAGSDWPLEQITLSDGKVLSGLIEMTEGATIEFVAIHRPPGKPMYLIIAPVERSAIVEWKRLPQAEREELRRRVHQFRGRMQIEGRRMEDLSLSGVAIGGAPGWQYQSDWLLVDSTAEETMTRRAIVRIEQMFTAFRRLLPPRAEVPQRPLRVHLFGATEEYQVYVRSLGLEISNPAFYSADQNLVAAGTDFNAFAAELADHTRQHKAVKRELDELMTTLPERLKKLAGELQSAGIDKDERRNIVTLEQKKWDDQRKALERRIARAERRNARLFEEVSRQMFARLFHEAFHAYLENYVFPHRSFDVPRWLNEGLAQVFESAQLDGDALRVDAPDLGALAWLVADLNGPEPLALAELLSANTTTFLVEHRRRSREVSRWYYYAWGLAYGFAFERKLLGSDALEEYVARSAAEQPAVARFERLVGEPLTSFEPKWREAMLRLGETWRSGKTTTQP